MDNRSSISRSPVISSSDLMMSRMVPGTVWWTQQHSFAGSCVSILEVTVVANFVCARGRVVWGCLRQWDIMKDSVSARWDELTPQFIDSRGWTPGFPDWVGVFARERRVR